MRAAVTMLVTLTACGRIDFGATAGRDAGIVAPLPDAAPVFCATEGAACDDLDICTTSSMCVSGTCVGPVHAQCTVANLQDEYSDVQGQDSWFYGAWNRSLDTDTTYDPTADFETFGFYTGDGAWRPADFAPTGPTFTWAYIHWWGGHPGSYPQARWPVRRWVSDVVGHAAVELYASPGDAGGDGVSLHIFVDGIEMFSRTTDGTPIMFTELVPIDVTIGTRVDVLLGFNAADGADTTEIQIKVVSR